MNSDYDELEACIRKEWESKRKTCCLCGRGQKKRPCGDCRAMLKLMMQALPGNREI